MPTSGKMISTGLNLVADWTANTGTQYVVEHYKQNIGEGWTKADTDTLYGTSDVQVTPAVKTYE